MTYVTLNWKWELEDDCTAQGGTLVVDSRKWADGDEPRICFQIVDTNKCDGWASVTFREVDPGTKTLFRPRGATPEIRRGKTCACHTQENANSEFINKWEESKTYKIEAHVQVPGGEERRSYGYVDYIGSG